MKSALFIVLLSCSLSAQVAGPRWIARAGDTFASEPDADSACPSLSADGRFVVFFSRATNLVPNDTNPGSDVFVWERASGLVERVSVSSQGAQANSGTLVLRGSTRPSLSADGRFASFGSDATNLVPGDTNGLADIFVRDRQLGTTERVNLSSTGTQNQSLSDTYDSAISGDGRYVVFFGVRMAGEATNVPHVYRRDRTLSTTERVDLPLAGGGESDGDDVFSMSADGRFIAFSSGSTNIVAGDSNQRPDVFVRDMQLGGIVRANVSTSGAEANAPMGPNYSPYMSGFALSTDGRFLAFSDAANNLAPTDTNGVWDVFVRDLVALTTVRASIASGGGQTNGFCVRPAISADGRFVSFDGNAGNMTQDLITGSFNTFRRDRVLGVNTLVCAGPSGIAGNGYSANCVMSDDGSVLAFQSLASNLVANDTNAGVDVFAIDLLRKYATYCTAQTNSLGCTAAMSATGTPSVTSPTPFVVSASPVLNQSRGILFYGVDGATLPFHGGTLCVRQPLTRTPIQNSGGNLAPTMDCSGTFSFDFNARIQAGVDPRLTFGGEVFCQVWSRDHVAAPTGTNLSDALSFLILP